MTREHADRPEQRLALEITSHRCANGETMEWRIVAGGVVLERLFTSDDDDEAIRHLVGRLVGRVL